MDVAIYSRAFTLCLSKHVKMNVPVNVKKNIAATVAINTQPKVHGEGLVSIILEVVINMKPGCVSEPLTPGSQEVFQTLEVAEGEEGVVRTPA